MRAAQSIACDEEPVTVAATATAAEWDDYVSSSPAATAYHLWNWRQVFERAFGHETIYLVARAGGRVEGVLPLVVFRSAMFGRFLISLPFVNYGGVLAEGNAARAALADRARREAASRGASYVELRHTQRQFPALPEMQHKVAMHLALPRDVESAWKGLDRKVRNSVRKAQKSGFETADGGLELLDEFYAVFACNMRDLGTPVYEKRFFAEVVRRVPGTRIHIVRLGDRAVAAGMTIAFRNSVENPWASSLRSFRSLNPNMLLYWQMISSAICEGREIFDFGRSTPGEGTWQFKKQWGAQASPFHWEYVFINGASFPDRNPKSGKFRVAVAIWRRLPLWAANLLGPAVVRHIP